MGEPARNDDQPRADSARRSKKQASAKDEVKEDGLGVQNEDEVFAFVLVRCSGRMAVPIGSVV